MLMVSTSDLLTKVTSEVSLRHSLMSNRTVILRVPWVWLCSPSIKCKLNLPKRTHGYITCSCGVRSNCLPKILIYKFHKANRIELLRNLRRNEWFLGAERLFQQQSFYVMETGVLCRIINNHRFIIQTLPKNPNKTTLTN